MVRDYWRGREGQRSGQCQLLVGEKRRRIQYPEGFEKTCVAAGTYLDQAGQWEMDNKQIDNIQSYANANANADADAEAK